MNMKAIGAVDIGGTKIAVGVVDDSGRVSRSLRSSNPNHRPVAQALALIAGMLRKAALEANVTIAGIGIGSTGPLDPLSGKFENLDTIPQWSGASPVDDLAREFHVSVAIENDADAGALAEASWGAGRNKSRLIYVTVGTGIGGGIILDGHLYRGVDGAHPEVAHQVIEAMRSAMLLWAARMLGGARLRSGDGAVDGVAARIHRWSRRPHRETHLRTRDGW